MILNVIMHNYVGTCKSFYDYNVVYNVLIEFLPLQSLVFVTHFQTYFDLGTMNFWKVIHRMKLFLSLHFSICHIIIIGIWKYVFTCVVIKMKVFQSCRNCVVCIALVPLVPQSCCTCVALVLHSYSSCLALV